jgi:hypothetical protein
MASTAYILSKSKVSVGKYLKKMLLSRSADDADKNPKEQHWGQ